MNLQLVALLSFVLPKFASPPCQYYWCRGIGMYHAGVPFNNMVFIKTSEVHTQTQWYVTSLSSVPYYKKKKEKKIKNTLINDRKATRKGSAGDSQTFDSWRMIKAVKRIVTTNVHSGHEICPHALFWAETLEFKPILDWIWVVISLFLCVDIIVHMF
jgi:hypothetical protein